MQDHEYCPHCDGWFTPGEGSESHDCPEAQEWREEQDFLDELAFKNLEGNQF